MENKKHTSEDLEEFNKSCEETNKKFKAYSDLIEKERKSISIKDGDEECDFCGGIRNDGKMLHWKDKNICLHCINSMLSNDERDYEKSKLKRKSCDVCEKPCEKEKEEFYSQFKQKIFICGMPGFTCSSCKDKGWSSISGHGGAPYILHLNQTNGTRRKLERGEVEDKSRRHYRMKYSKEDEIYRKENI